MVNDGKGPYRENKKSYNMVDEYILTVETMNFETLDNFPEADLFYDDFFDDQTSNYNKKQK